MPGYKKTFAVNCYIKYTKQLTPMALSELELVHSIEVKKWLDDNLQLTPYQKSIVYSDEYDIFRNFEFYTYKKPSVKTSLLWRFTILIYPIYYILALFYLGLKWVFTGKWGFNQKFYDNFHGKWSKKLNI